MVQLLSRTFYYLSQTTEMKAEHMPTSEEIISALQKIAILNGLSDGELGEISKAACQQQTLAEGSKVDLGKYAIYQKSSHQATKSAWIGDKELFFTESKDFSIKAGGEYLLLDKVAFGEIVRSSPTIFNSIMASLQMASQKDESRDFAFFSSTDVEEKYYSDLKEQAYFFKEHLSLDTAHLAKGCQAVCIFVNDTADAKVLQKLKEFNVKLVALRCAGTNNVDLDCCAQLGIKVTNVPSYHRHQPVTFNHLDMVLTRLLSIRLHYCCLLLEESLSLLIELGKATFNFISKPVVSRV